MDFLGDFFFEVIIPLAAAALALFLLALGIRQVEHHYEVSQCWAFSASSGYQTKFADYTFWQYECLTKTNEGKWVPRDALRGVNQ